MSLQLRASAGPRRVEGGGGTLRPCAAVQGNVRSGFVSSSAMSLDSQLETSSDHPVVGVQAFCLDFHPPWPVSLVLNRRVRVMGGMRCLGAICLSSAFLP